MPRGRYASDWTASASGYRVRAMKTLTAVFAIVCAASVAHADRDRLDLLSEGAARSNAGDHAGAIALFEQAYYADLDPSMLPILATEYRRAGLQQDSMDYFC